MAGVYLVDAGLPVLIPFMMLFLPFLDDSWKYPDFTLSPSSLAQWAAVALATAVLLWTRGSAEMFLNILLLTALPEEWFFRGYVQKQLGNSIEANLMATVLFAIVHWISRGSAVALLVVSPSLLFGYLYSRQKDIILVILLHAFSNLLFLVYLRQTFNNIGN